MFVPARHGFRRAIWCFANRAKRSFGCRASRGRSRCGRSVGKHAGRFWVCSRRDINRRVASDSPRIVQRVEANSAFWTLAAAVRAGTSIRQLFEDQSNCVGRHRTGHGRKLFAVARCGSLAPRSRADGQTSRVRASRSSHRGSVSGTGWRCRDRCRRDTIPRGDARIAQQTRPGSQRQLALVCHRPIRHKGLRLDRRRR